VDENGAVMEEEHEAEESTSDSSISVRREA